MIGVSFIVFIDDAKLTDVYWGLRISILFEILIAIMGIIQFKDFFNYSNINDLNKVKQYTKFLTIVNVLCTYNFIFVAHNLYYTLALQYETDLEKYGFGVLYLLSFLCYRCSE